MRSTQYNKVNSLSSNTLMVTYTPVYIDRYTYWHITYHLFHQILWSPHQGVNAANSPNVRMLEPIFSLKICIVNNTNAGINSF